MKLKDKPKDGWYWHRASKENDAYMVEIKDGYIIERAFSQFPHQNFIGDWFGPIIPPEFVEWRDFP